LSSKIALLIDAENVSYKDLPFILKAVRRQGQIILQAVYGNWERPHLQNWLEVAKKNNLEIRHQANNANTKNATDMKLIMDAGKVLYKPSIDPVDVFCLVTNDADYVPLCDQIHEEEKSIIGIGYQNASGALIRSCDQFIFIRNGKSPVQPPAKSLVAVPKDVSISLPKTPKTTKQPKTSKSTKQPKITKSTKQPKTSKVTDQVEIQKLISKAFAKVSQDANGWVLLAELGMALRQVQKDFKTNNYGHATLSKLLQSMPDFVELQVKGNVIQSARLKNKIVAKSSKRNAPAKRLKLNTLESLISEAFAKAPQEADGWVTLSALGTALSQVQKGFQTSYYGHANLKKLLQSMPDFVQLRLKGSVNSARLKK
jgi:uncharacterized protein (TIGR00288 family)